MPHVSLEYSANLDERADIQGLCDEILRVMLNIGTFDVGAVRVRAVRCEAFAIADRHPDNAFVDISLRMAPRDDAVRSTIGEIVFEVAAAYLAPLLESPHFALSLEVRDISRAASWRRNTMHLRLRNSQ